MGEEILLCADQQVCKLDDCVHGIAHARRPECHVRCPQTGRCGCVVAEDGDAVMAALTGGFNIPKNVIYTYKRL